MLPQLGGGGGGSTLWMSEQAYLVAQLGKGGVWEGVLQLLECGGDRGAIRPLVVAAAAHHRAEGAVRALHIPTGVLPDPGALLAGLWSASGRGASPPRTVPGKTLEIGDCLWVDRGYMFAEVRGGIPRAELEAQVKADHTFLRLDAY